MGPGRDPCGLGRPTRGSGFSLIEVLIALVILAIGLGGVTAMQMSTYKQLNTSHNFTTAAMLAGEIADRMAANSVEALAGAYSEPPGGSPKDCAEQTCAPDEIAAYDLAVWQARVTGDSADPKVPGSLPAGSATVTRIGTSDEFNVIVRWDDDLSGSTGTDCAALDPNAVQDPDNLDCFVLTVGF